jgi:hypothetical protein
VRFIELIVAASHGRPAYFWSRFKYTKTIIKKIMKRALVIPCLSLVLACSSPEKQPESTVSEKNEGPKHLFMDVHNLEPGKVTFEGVAEAHQKDLQTQGKYNVNFIKYWVDESAGKVYCLAESPDSASLSNSHKEAHGLVPDFVYNVSDGPEANAIGDRNFFLDIHKLGGPVTAQAVADAHTKDLAVQGKRDVNFLNYWVDEKAGIVTCLSEAKDSIAVISTHREAHGLIPAEIHQVKQGQ